MLEARGYIDDNDDDDTLVRENPFRNQQHLVYDEQLNSSLNKKNSFIDNQNDNRFDLSYNTNHHLGKQQQVSPTSKANNQFSSPTQMNSHEQYVKVQLGHDIPLQGLRKSVPKTNIYKGKFSYITYLNTLFACLGYLSLRTR